MFSVAFLIGLFANVIFLLGIAQILSSPVIVVVTILYIFFAILFWDRYKEDLSARKIIHEFVDNLSKHPVIFLCITIAFMIMFLGSLVPETAFDALWYHLTLPKMFLEAGGINFIPGSTFYYSVMPKLGEMLFIPALVFQGDTLAHMINLFFACLIALSIYSITKKYTSSLFALLSIVLFLSNIVILWEATTAYIDLIWAFFEIMALWGMLNYLETKKNKWLMESAVLFGLALETKLLALFSLPVFIVCLVVFGFKSVRGRALDSFAYILISLLIPAGWFVLAFVNTGNPVYPIFSGYQVALGTDWLAFPQTILDLVTVFITASDPVSPIYLMLLPLCLVAWRKAKLKEKKIILLAAIGIFCWTITPKTGGGRFMVAYLPLLSVAYGIVLYGIRDQKRVLTFSMICIFSVFVVSLVYRGVAQVRSLPVILGLESKQTYLSKRLNFKFGDFYDMDGKMKNMVGSHKRVLLYGFHNLYYLDVPFIDSSYIQKGDTFDFIATQHTQIPKRFSYWQPIYYEKKTGVTLYSLGQEWIY